MRSESVAGRARRTARRLATIPYPAPAAPSLALCARLTLRLPLSPSSLPLSALASPLCPCLLVLVFAVPSLPRTSPFPSLPCLPLAPWPLGLWLPGRSAPRGVQRNPGRGAAGAYQGRAPRGIWSGCPRRRLPRGAAAAAGGHSVEPALPTTPPIKARCVPATCVRSVNTVFCAVSCVV